MNELRAEKQANEQNLEVLQEESYRVIMALESTHGIVKKAAEESVKKMQAWVTIETIF